MLRIIALLTLLAAPVAAQDTDTAGKAPVMAAVCKTSGAIAGAGVKQDV